MRAARRKQILEDLDAIAAHVQAKGISRDQAYDLAKSIIEEETKAISMRHWSEARRRVRQSEGELHDLERLDEILH